VAEKFTSTSSAEAWNTMQDFLQGLPNLKVVYTFNGQSEQTLDIADEAIGFRSA
jgi:ABC-type sugar transport system substrate-binding protein